MGVSTSVGISRNSSRSSRLLSSVIRCYRITRSVFYAYFSSLKFSIIPFISVNSRRIAAISAGDNRVYSYSGGPLYRSYRSIVS